jgi:hypothetical protein
MDNHHKKLLHIAKPSLHNNGLDGDEDDDSPNTPSLSPKPNIDNPKEGDQAEGGTPVILDYNQIFQKGKTTNNNSDDIDVSQVSNVLRHLHRQNLTSNELKQENHQTTSSYHSQLESFYSDYYSSYKTPIIGLFYFFQINIPSSRKIIELLEGCDNQQDYHVDLKEFALRYCSSETKLMFFICFKYFSLIFDNCYVMPSNDGTGPKLIRPDGSKEDLGKSGHSLPHISMLKKGGGGRRSGRNNSNSNSNGNGNNGDNSITEGENSEGRARSPLGDRVNRSRGNSPSAGQSRKQKQQKDENGLNSNYFMFLCFLFHFLLIKSNDFVIYFHWLITYANKTPLFKEDLLLIVEALISDRQINDAKNKADAAASSNGLLGLLSRLLQRSSDTASSFLTSKDPSSSGYTATSHSGKSGKSGRYGKSAILNEIKDDMITSGQLRLIDTKMKGIISSSLYALKKAIFSHTYSYESFWKDEILFKVSHIIENNIIVHYDNHIKHLKRNEEINDVCNDFKIIKSKKVTEKLLRKYIRTIEKYEKMLFNEQQSLSDISGINMKRHSILTRVYQDYLLPFKERYFSNGSASIYPEKSGKDSSKMLGRLSILHEGASMKENDGPLLEQDTFISFKALTKKPEIPSTNELNASSNKTRKKAYDAINEVERLLIEEEIERQEREERERQAILEAKASNKR